MERGEYLKRVQSAAYNLKHGGLKSGDCVICDGVRYYPVKYCLSYDADKLCWVHTAVLHDEYARSVREVKLCEVEEVNT